MILSPSQALNSSHKLLHWNVISNHRISYTNTPCLCPGSTQSWRLSKQNCREPSSGCSCISRICTHKPSLGWGQIHNSKYIWLQRSILKQGKSSIWWLKYPVQSLCGHTLKAFRMTQHRDNILLRNSRPKPWYETPHHRHNRELRGTMLPDDTQVYNQPASSTQF